MRSLIKLSGLAVGMILLMTAMRGLMTAARDPVWTADWTFLSLPMGHALIGAAVAARCWQSLARVTPAPRSEDPTTSAVFVAARIQQQTELRLASVLGADLAALGAALLVFPSLLAVPALLWAAAHLLSISIEMALILILVTQRELRWIALAVLAAVVLMGGFCIWGVVQAIEMD